MLFHNARDIKNTIAAIIIAGSIILFSLWLITPHVETVSYFTIDTVYKTEYLVTSSGRLLPRGNNTIGEYIIVFENNLTGDIFSY